MNKEAREYIDDRLHSLFAQYTEPQRDRSNLAEIIQGFDKKLTEIEHKREEAHARLENQIGSIDRYIIGDSVNDGIVHRVRQLEKTKKKSNNKERGIVTALTTGLNAFLTWLYFKMNE